MLVQDWNYMISLRLHSHMRDFFPTMFLGEEGGRALVQSFPIEVLW